MCNVYIPPDTKQISLEMLFTVNPLDSTEENKNAIHHELYTHIHTQHTTVLRLFGFCPGQPGWAGTRRNIHPLTPVVVIKYPYLLPVYAPQIKTNQHIPFKVTQDLQQNSISTFNNYNNHIMIIYPWQQAELMPESRWPEHTADALTPH